MKHSKELIPKIAKQGVSNGEQSVILSVKHINHKNGINRIFFLPKMGLVLLATLWIIMMHAVTGVYGALPTAYTYPQVIWNGDSVLLQGAVNPGGKATTVWFEWGLTTGLGNRTAVTNVGSGNSLVWVRQPLSNITAGTIYYYQVVASNSSSVVRGAIQMFGKGTVVAWGNNASNQCDVPVGLSNVVAVAGWDHSLALKQDGTVVAWGLNDSGQCNVPAGLNNVVEVAAGGYHSLVLKQDGTVVAWGLNDSGQCNIPVGLNNVVAVAAGWAYNLALKQDGTVVVWGDNYYGQCNVPAGLSNVVAVAAGFAHSLALKQDGTVVAWGWNNYGQCNVPAGLSNVVAVAGGGNYSLALKQDGTVVAWGWNNYGQCNVPAGLTNVVAVAAGASHSLALKQDGTVVAWGWNYYGQCNVPAGLSNVVAVAGDGYHSLALKVDLFANPPVIMQQPAGTNVMVGGTAVFAVEASGRLLSYQWYHVTGTSTNLLVGQTNATLMITNVQRTDAGWYYVVVSDSVHTVTSAMAQLVVIAVMRPQIVGSVVSGTVGKLQFMTEPGVVYTLQWAENMNPPINWQDVPGSGATVIGDGTLKMLIDTNASAPYRFYRIKATLP